jgi:glycosyltransferase involved in cell wall biosynthesis
LVRAALMPQEQHGMTATPNVDVNMMVYNCVDTVGAAIESVLAQTWPSVSLTLFDNNSTDGTLQVAQDYATRHPAIRIKRNRCNVGPVANIQRALWFGDADYIMPKTGDDLIAPDYIERLMGVLLAHPACAMCHAAGLVFTGVNQVSYRYPPEHWLQATGPDPVERARHVMQRYTSAPAFWGIYRRDAVDQLSTIRYRSGFDHAMLAELALYGEMRHVPEALYWRRGGGKPVVLLGRGATEQGNRGVPLDDVLSEQRWRTPLITTAYAHMETFAAVRLPLSQRLMLMDAVPEIFRARWLSLMRREAAALHSALPGMLRTVAVAGPVEANWLVRTLTEVLLGAQAILPEDDFTLALLEITALAGEPRHRAPTDAIRQCA